MKLLGKDVGDMLGISPKILVFKDLTSEPRIQSWQIKVFGSDSWSPNEID